MDEAGYAIAVDDDGNVLVTGQFRGTATIGTAVMISQGEDDIFLAKLSNSGSWIWSRQAGGPGGDDGLDITTDLNGNVYLTGSFAGTVSFGSTTLTGAGYTDAFAAKLNSAGTWLWANQGGGTGWDAGSGIAVDNAGNVLVSGKIYEDVTFGGTSLAGRAYDIFAAKLSSTGNWVWAKKAGSVDLDWSNGITTDNEGNAYLTGFFMSTAAFGTIALISAGSQDVFVAKISSEGLWQWARRAGGTDSEEGYAIDADGSGRISITGCFRETAVFGTTSLTSAGEEDIFVARISSNGVWQWAQRAGGIEDDKGHGIAVDARSYVRLTGYFSRTADFGSLTLEGVGNAYLPDIFVAKITARPLAPANVTASLSGYDNLQLDWDDVTQDTFNNYITGVHYLVKVIHDQPYGPYANVIGEDGSITASEFFIDGGASFEIEFFRISAVLGD